MANRIAKARFSLDGKTYQPAANDGPNALHGGLRGFDEVLWTPQSAYLSTDAEEGYRRSLRVTAVYALNERDKPTVIGSSIAFQLPDRNV